MQRLTSDNSGKRPYTTPQVTVHGTLEEITKQNKDLGGADGITFQQQPVFWTS
jgi:hypothetical protein